MRVVSAQRAIFHSMIKHRACSHVASDFEGTTLVKQIAEVQSDYLSATKMEIINKVQQESLTIA